MKAKQTNVSSISTMNSHNGSFVSSATSAWNSVMVEKGDQAAMAGTPEPEPADHPAIAPTGNCHRSRDRGEYQADHAAGIEHVEHDLLDRLRYSRSARRIRRSAPGVYPIDSRSAAARPDPAQISPA